MKSSEDDICWFGSLNTGDLSRNDPEEMPVNLPLHSEAQENGQHAKPIEWWRLSEREFDILPALKGEDSQALGYYGSQLTCSIGWNAPEV
ncbi:hypothetical protein U4E84_05445 [Halorubrum sp. AD140]|uniref:hypothetical protein n=1 Tax=Halorubrum sp. AD140 TaxID=3050073 RepID=UPI002ACCA79E|nr:hypothetical protein [Halorubrum sp. AD140]MDZ5810791.1 hypothetical protein [Halorubrum sp. AD140]